MSFDFENTKCPCGKAHTSRVKAVYKGKGAIGKLSEAVRALGGTRAFLLGDENTMRVAKAAVFAALEDGDIPFSFYTYPMSPEPDEAAVGAAAMHFDPSCDVVIGIGSGVINDIGKLLCHITKKPYIIVATAPSMDGYASESASMAVDGLKVSLPAKCAEIIIGDTDILKTAPDTMLRAGLGDMLAKYVSIGEWRLANCILGEYYCENVADLIRTAVQKCVENAEGLLKREDAAVEAVFEGLVLGGTAMAYAGVSRPASGVEHYFSHVWDMRALSFATPAAPHGVQCALGTLYAAKMYEKIQKMKPDAEKARKHAADFPYEKHAAFLTRFLGKGANAMIALEEKEGKYNKEKHAERLSVILEKWETLTEIMRKEIPTATKISEILEKAGLTEEPSFQSMQKEDVKSTFLASADIRDKYVLSRLAWDLGVQEEVMEGV